MSQSDQIDEVALNVLLAEGIDFSTALEASRIPVAEQESDEVTATASNAVTIGIEIVVVVLAVIVMVVVWMLL